MVRYEAATKEVARKLMGRYNKIFERKFDGGKVYAELKKIQNIKKSNDEFRNLSSQEKIEAVIAELAVSMESSPSDFYRKDSKSSLKPGHGAEYKWRKNNNLWKDVPRGIRHIAYMGARAIMPWRWHPVRGVKRTVRGTKDYLVKPSEEESYSQLHDLVEEHGDVFSDQVRKAIDRGKTAEVYHTALNIMEDSGLLKKHSRSLSTAKADLENLGFKASKDIVSGMKRDVKEKRRKSLEEHAESTLSIILLGLITFSLVASIIDNPSITGYSVLGVSNATNTTLVLNVIAFIFVVLLIYPSGDIIEQFKPLRTKSRTKTRRKRRK